MRDGEILAKVKELIAEEHLLRERVGTGDVSADEEMGRVRALSVRLL